MRIAPLLIATLALATVSADAQPTLDAATARQQIDIAYAVWSKARTSLDRTTVDRMLAPDFYAQVPGQRMTRAEFIDQIMAPNAVPRLVRYDPKILTIQRDGDKWVCVITEKLEYERAGPDGSPQRAYQLWITRDVWRRDGDQWRATSTDAVSYETWPWGKAPPFPDWGK